jgi:hypothetical protein
MESKSSLMEPGKHEKKKPPLKSIHGRRCLTKCYPKGEMSVHPTLLIGLTRETGNYCSIDPTYSKESQLLGPSAEREWNIIFTDACRLEDNNFYTPPPELESILLSYYFNPRDFLTNMYNLNTFDEVIHWTVENDYLPFDTIKRVHNCAWKAYGDKLESLIPTVVDYYYQLAKKKWLKDYIKNIKESYSFSITVKENAEGNSIYHFILDNYFTPNFFTNTIKKYIYQYQDEWDNIPSHYGNIKNFIYQKLLEILQESLIIQTT